MNYEFSVWVWVGNIPENFIMQGTAWANVVASIGFGLFLPTNIQ